MNAYSVGAATVSPQNAQGLHGHQASTFRLSNTALISLQAVAAGDPRAGYAYASRSTEDAAPSEQDPAASARIGRSGRTRHERAVDLVYRPTVSGSISAG